MSSAITKTGLQCLQWSTSSRAFDSPKYSRNGPMAGSHPVSTPFKTLTILSQSEGAGDLPNAPAATPAAPRCRRQGGGGMSLHGPSWQHKRCSLPSGFGGSPHQLSLVQKNNHREQGRGCLGCLWRGTSHRERALSEQEHWENWMKRGVDDREPRSFWAGPDACLRGGPLRGFIHPPPGAGDPPLALTPRVMNEQGLPSARDSQRIFISFHFWPFWYSANPQGLACIIISEDQKRVFRVSTNLCWLDLMVLQPILILIALLKYSKYLYTN